MRIFKCYFCQNQYFINVCYNSSSNLLFKINVKQFLEIMFGVKISGFFFYIKFELNIK